MPDGLASCSISSSGMGSTELLLTSKTCVQECDQLSIISNERGTAYGRLQHGLIKDVKYGGSRL